MRKSTGPSGPGPEKVQRADDLVPQPHRHCLDAAEPGLHASGREPRPSLARFTHIGAGDGLPGAEAVQARALVIQAGRAQK